MLIGAWFRDLQEKKPGFCDAPLTGTPPQIAAALRGYADLGVQHVIFRYAPYNQAARERLTEALALYRRACRDDGSQNE